MSDPPRRYRTLQSAGLPSRQALPLDRDLRIVTWNLQYCGGRQGVFFYDGGRRVRVPRAEQDRVFDGIVEVLRRLDADVLILQEVDRGSARTDRVDQLARLCQALPGFAAVSTPIHRNRFVPHPWWHPLGRVDFHLATLARARPESPRRVALPLLPESPLVQHFNLHRALLIAELPLADGRRFAIGNTHLSAFSGGDDTLSRQMLEVERWYGDAAPLGILGGDLNLLPPGDDPARLGTDGVDHPRERPEIDAFFARHRSALDPVAQRVPQAGTYLPPGADRPDRTLDWIFAGLGWEVSASRVEPVDPLLSDHWPIVADIRIR
ncbi:MAG: hypothetical protein EXR71_05910 [Myxococcales bacterium]|nr:hypothetical protein [Myxococcales bacterium]